VLAARAAIPLPSVPARGRGTWAAPGADVSAIRTDTRRALRIAVNIPTVVEAVGQPPLRLHENLARVYTRVRASDELIGRKFPGTIRDLSTNGAFITGDPLPLLSRVAFAFNLDGFGRVEAVAWSLWRRAGDCELPRDEGAPLHLARGFGVLFEAIPLDARLAIHAMVSGADADE
jgi:hypothetical protein